MSIHERIDAILAEVDRLIRETEELTAALVAAAEALPEDEE